MIFRTSDRKGKGPPPPKGFHSMREGGDELLFFVRPEGRAPGLKSGASTNVRGFHARGVLLEKNRQAERRLNVEIEVADFFQRSVEYGAAARFQGDDKRQG